MKALISFVTASLFLSAGCGASVPRPEIISFETTIDDGIINLSGNYIEYNLKFFKKKYSYLHEKILPIIGPIICSAVEKKDVLSLTLSSSVSTEPFEEFFSEESNVIFLNCNECLDDNNNECNRKIFIRPSGGYTLAHPSEYLKNTVDVKELICYAQVSWKDVEWDDKYNQYVTSQKLIHSQKISIQCYDLDNIFNEKYLSEKIALNIIDAATSRPVEEFEVTVTEIIPQGQLLPAHFGSEFKQNKLAKKIINSLWLQMWLADNSNWGINESVNFIGHETGRIEVSVPRISGKQDSLRILVRSDQYIDYEGIVSFEGEMNAEYDINLSRIGVNENLETDFD